MSPSKFTIPLGTLYKKKGFSKDKETVAVGLEFENEFKTGIDLPAVPGFTVHQDNSLRLFGFEYVNNPPVDNVEEAYKLCENLFKAIAAKKGSRKMTNSIRTSTHVHFDVTKYTYPDLFTFLCTYWSIEEFLSYFCGAQRQGNLFALRLKDATYMKSDLASAIEKREPGSAQVFTNAYRYASANLNAVPKFGSLEFRLMRGVDQAADAITWLKALEAVRQFSLKFKHPKELCDYYMDKDTAEEFPCSVLGESLFKEFLKYTPWKKEDLKYSVQSGFLGVLPIVGAGGKWDFTEEIQEEKRRREEQSREGRPQLLEPEDVLVDENRPRDVPAGLREVPLTNYMRTITNVAGAANTQRLQDGRPVAFLNFYQRVPDFDDTDQVEIRNLVTFNNWNDE